MSRSTISGRHCERDLQTVRAGVGALHAVALVPQGAGEHHHQVDVVIDHQHAHAVWLARRLRRPASTVRGTPARGASGSLTMNSLPASRPCGGLWASMVPPCSSTSRWASESPMPSPPVRAGQRAVGLREQVEDARQEFRVDAHAVVAHAHQHARSPVALAPALRSGRPRRVYLAALFSRLMKTSSMPRRVGVRPDRLGAEVQRPARACAARSAA